MWKRWGICLLAALLVLLTIPAAKAGPAAGSIVAGYYPSWAESQGWPVEKLRTEGLTQINYAFASIEDGRVTVTERDRTKLRALVGLKGPEIILSAGGWDGSAGFSDAAASPASRERFAQSCLDLILELGLNGVDLDWEYPVSGGAAGVTHRPQDKQNFTLLLKAIREKLDRQSRQDGKRYRLTIAGGAGTGYLNCIEPKAVSELVDHIFLMAYDFSGPWDSRTGHNAPLDGADAAITAWIRQGVPAEKLVLGIPLYGYIFQGASGLNQPFSSAKSVPYDVLKRDYLPVLQKKQDAAAQVPYLTGGGQFITYDDPESAAAKGALARERGLGGVGFWELSQDRAGELVQAALTEGVFYDVPPDAWYADAVTSLSAAGIMQGVGDGRFAPERTVTRGQLSAILHRIAGRPSASGTPFTDIAPDAYCAEAAAWAEERGILQGYADGTFRPNQPVSRQQFAAALHRYAAGEGWDNGRRASLRGFPDEGQVSEYAREPLRWALGAGIMQGRSDGRLDPNGSATRAQTAVLLCRFLEMKDEIAHK